MSATVAVRARHVFYVLIGAVFGVVLAGNATAAHAYIAAAMIAWALQARGKGEG